jgi:hypothetical protein
MLALLPHSPARLAPFPRPPTRARRRRPDIGPRRAAPGLLSGRNKRPRRLQPWMARRRERPRRPRPALGSTRLGGQLRARRESARPLVAAAARATVANLHAQLTAHPACGFSPRRAACDSSRRGPCSVFGVVAELMHPVVAPSPVIRGPNTLRCGWPAHPACGKRRARAHESPIVTRGARPFLDSLSSAIETRDTGASDQCSSERGSEQRVPSAGRAARPVRPRQPNQCVQKG